MAAAAAGKEDPTEHRYTTAIRLAELEAESGRLDGVAAEAVQQIGELPLALLVARKQLAELKSNPPL